MVPWEAWLVARDGAEHIIELTVSELQSETHRIGLGVFVRDVTESRRLAEELSFQASHDPLTDLPNRRAFERQLGALHRASRETGQQHALCFVDLDRVKIINDTCGHAAGDELLRKADAACYLAKEGGRNRVHIHDDDDISLARRRGEMRWVPELERALGKL